MRVTEKITSTTNIEAILQFFLYAFCPIFQTFLHERRQNGLSSEEREALTSFIVNIRHRSASLGDVWWHTALRCEKPIQARVRKLAELFEKWCSVTNNDISGEEVRKSIADEITEAIVKLGKTYRNNIHLIRNDLDLKQLESDIRYFEALRTLGLSALSGVVSSAFGEIFSNMRREPVVIQRKAERAKTTEDNPVAKQGRARARRNT